MSGNMVRDLWSPAFVSPSEEGGIAPIDVYMQVMGGKTDLSAVLGHNAVTSAPVPKVPQQPGQYTIIDEAGNVLPPREY